MPANRSRTQEWRRCLKQVHERNGALELAVAQHDSETGGQHLVWRVRLLRVSNDQIVVEQPSTLGELIRIEPGVELIVVLCIGQNRWMFKTRNLGPIPVQTADRKTLAAIALAMPESVQRCQRRNHYRIETAALNLPQVEMWPLLDPKSVLVAERACVLAAERASNPDATIAVQGPDHDLTMPEVGPRFTATLVNLGGGGVGLRVGPQDSQALMRHKLFWMRMTLPSTACSPICATGKLVHTHMESNHDVYAGMAFDFSFNPSHQRFVVEQISRYIAMQQKSQHFQPATADQRLSA